MKKLFNIIAFFCILASVSSCWKENLIEAGASRHQVQELVAVAGDEEVTLSWSIPEGWEPTDYLITYTDAEGKAQSIYTQGATTYTVTGLVNGFEYTFNVQAIYGDLVSGVIFKAVKPVTSRIAVKDLSFTTDPDKEKKEQYILVTWTKPSDLVLNYQLTYYPETDKNNKKTIEIDGKATEYKITGVNNETNYVINVVANYPKGSAEAVMVKVRFVIPYFVSRDTAASGQPITYTFNFEKYPTAKNIKWTFPDKTVLEGNEVTYGIFATGVQKVVLSAEVNDEIAEWDVEVTLREYVIDTNNLDKGSSAYQGFKGGYPVFSPDRKTVYGLTFQKPIGLYAYDTDSGVEKWRFIPAAVAAGYNPATVNPVNGDIYFGTTTAGQFYCVGPDGNQKWMFTGAASMQSTAPAVSADGSVVYVLDKSGNLFAIYAASGLQKWTKKLGAAGAALLINGDTVIAAVQNNSSAVYFLSAADGTEVATTLTTTNAPTDISGFAVADDKKTAYLSMKPSGILSIDLEKKTLIKELMIGTNNLYAPVVSSDGVVVVGSKDGCIYGIKGDLSEVLWTIVHTGTAVSNAFNYSHPAADTAGKIYITSGGVQNTNYIIKAADGSVLDSYQYGSANQKQMGGNNFADGVFYAAFIGGGSENGALIGKYVGGTRKFWGGPGGDPCGSGCIQSPLLN